MYWATLSNADCLSDEFHSLYIKRLNLHASFGIKTLELPTGPKRLFSQDFHHLQDTHLSSSPIATLRSSHRSSGVRAGGCCRTTRPPAPRGQLHLLLLLTTTLRWLLLKKSSGLKNLFGVQIKKQLGWNPPLPRLLHCLRALRTCKICLSTGW